MGLALPVVLDHAAQLRRRAFTLREVPQVLQHRLLSAVASNKLIIVLAIVVLILVLYLLRCQSLLELQLLLHLLLLVGQDGVLTGATALRWVVHGVVAADGDVHFVLAGRVLVGFRIRHHHLLVLLLLLLHDELLLRWMHQLVARSGHASSLQT